MQKRLIKFRGKRLDNGEWVYGDMLHGKGNLAWIITDAELTLYGPDSIDAFPEFASPKNQNVFRVDPATVGQYTGLDDKNGVGIYEGDVVKVRVHYDFDFGFKNENVYTGEWLTGKIC